LAGFFKATSTKLDDSSTTWTMPWDISNEPSDWDVDSLMTLTRNRGGDPSATTAPFPDTGIDPKAALLPVATADPLPDTDADPCPRSALWRVSFTTLTMELMTVAVPEAETDPPPETDDAAETADCL
jgi:hypothetical protein